MVSKQQESAEFFKSKAIKSRLCDDWNVPITASWYPVRQ